MGICSSKPKKQQPTIEPVFYLTEEEKEQQVIARLPSVLLKRQSFDLEKFLRDWWPLEGIKDREKKQLLLGDQNFDEIIHPQAVALLFFHTIIAIEPSNFYKLKNIRQYESKDHKFFWQFPSSVSMSPRYKNLKKSEQKFLDLMKPLLSAKTQSQSLMSAYLNHRLLKNEFVNIPWGQSQLEKNKNELQAQIEEIKSEEKKPQDEPELELKFIKVLTIREAAMQLRNFAMIVRQFSNLFPYSEYESQILTQSSSSSASSGEDHLAKREKITASTADLFSINQDNFKIILSFLVHQMPVNLALLIFKNLTYEMSVNAKKSVPFFERFPRNLVLKKIANSNAAPDFDCNIPFLPNDLLDEEDSGVNDFQSTSCSSSLFASSSSSSGSFSASSFTSDFAGDYSSSLLGLFSSSTAGVSSSSSNDELEDFPMHIPEDVTPEQENLVQGFFS